MIPPSFLSFFITMAGVGATLFGLIFVAISIAPGSITVENAPLDRQIKATAAYVALLNPVMVSLFALVPHQTIGYAVLSLSSVGLLNTLAITLTILREGSHLRARLRSSILILVSFFLYGLETYLGVRLLALSPSEEWFFFLADLLIFLTLFGVIRAWELIGIRQFHLRDWISSLNIRKKDKK